MDFARTTLLAALLAMAPAALSAAHSAGAGTGYDGPAHRTTAIHGGSAADPGVLPPSSRAAAQGEGIVPSPGFLERQAEYLQVCSDSASTGDLDAQLCRLGANGGLIDADAIRTALAKIDNREDCADFYLNTVLRILAMYSGHPDLDPGLQADMERSVLDFKYWLDEPGPDMMCWWSENHQVLFHTAELIAGQLFPDRVFSNSGMTGAEHISHALPLVHEWLDYRSVFGFSEWHSNVYFNEDMPALLNLADLAWDASVATKAAMILDLMTFDFANTYFKGVYATVHGRTYEGKQVGGSNDSTSEAAWILLGLGGYRSPNNFTGSFLATSLRYWPPDILEAVAADAETFHEHRQRDGIDVTDGPLYGIGYEDFGDIMFWWGMGAYVTSQVIEGTFEMVDYYDLWDSYFWSDVAFLEPLVGSPILEPLSAHLDDLTRGSALEAMDTYVYRTPHYQLSGAQNYNPGLWGSQQHIWQATLDADAVVFTTYPGGMEDDYTAGAWTGGWLPRALFYRNVGIILYRRDRYPQADERFFVEYTHAYFPKWAFDEIRSAGSWTFGKKGDAYVALYSDNPVVWAEASPESDYELIADGFANTWIVELGSLPESGTFDAFVEAVSSAPVIISGDTVDYDSPSLGQLSVSAGGQLFAEGRHVDTGPYDRWDNRYASQPFGTNRTVIVFEGRQLILDFDSLTRTVVAAGSRGAGM